MDAMHAAVEGGDLKMIKFLSFKVEAKLHAKNEDGWTLLHYAAQMGRCDAARYLIDELKLNPQDRTEVSEWAYLHMYIQLQFIYLTFMQVVATSYLPSISC